MQNPSAQILACLRRLLVIMCLAGVLTGISANHPGKAEAGDKRHFEYPVRFHLRFMGDGTPFSAYVNYNNYYLFKSKDWPVEYFKNQFDAGYIEISKDRVLSYPAKNTPSQKVFDHVIGKVNRLRLIDWCGENHFEIPGQPFPPPPKDAMPCRVKLGTPLFAAAFLRYLKTEFMLYPTKIEEGYK